MRLIVVSVPLPGFNYWRRSKAYTVTYLVERFSPVAGIQLLATFVEKFKDRFYFKFQSRCRDSIIGDKGYLNYLVNRFIRFSPVAGIQLLATVKLFKGNCPYCLFQSRCRDSIIGDRLLTIQQALRGRCFSPVAGIQLLATLALN